MLLIGCRKKAPIDEPRALSMVVTGLTQPQEQSFFNLFIRLFEAENNTTVTVNYLSSQAFVALLNEDPLAHEHDIILVDTANMKHYLDANWMHDISDVVSTLPSLTQLFETYTKREGRDFFIPVSFDIYITLYNKLALPFIPENVSVKRNSDDEITQIEAISWKAFHQWAETIKQETTHARFGFPMARTGSQTIFPLSGMLLSYGVEEMYDISSESSLEALNAIASLASKNAFLDETILSPYNQPTTLLQQQLMWLSFGHIGPLGTVYRANPNDYVLGPAPTGPTNLAGSTAGAWAFGILEESKNKDLANDWLTFIMQSDINYLYTSGLGGVMSPISTVKNELGNSAVDHIMQIGFTVMEGNIVIGVPDTSYFSNWDALKHIYVDLYERLLTGEAITQTEVEIFQSQIDALRLT